MSNDPNAIKAKRKHLLATQTGKSLFLTPPETKQELKDWVKLFLGITIIDRQTCEHHNSQMDYFWHTYKDMGDVVVKANRGGGKTALGGAATVVDSILKPGYQTRIIGGCLTGDSAIITATGLRKIKEIKQGDWALTRSGLRRVGKTTQRVYSGPLFHITPSRGDKIGITPEHLVWVVETSKCIYTGKPCRPMCAKKNKCKYAGSYSAPKWVPASDLDKSKHWLLFPKRVCGDVEPNQLGIKEPIHRFLEMMGAFVGSKVKIENDSLQFAILRDSRDMIRENLFVEMLSSSGKNILNARLKTKEAEIFARGKRRVTVNYSLKMGEMQEFFEKIGIRWQDRYFPFGYLNLDKDRIARVLKGITMTNSCDNGRALGRIKYYIKNPILACQIYLMFIKLGYLPNIIVPAKKNGDSYYRIVMTLSDQVDFYKKAKMSELYPVGRKEESKKNRYNSYVMNMGDWHWVSISNIKYQINAKETVYNLEMEGGDPSYCAPGITVHNSLVQSENMYTYTNVWEQEGYEFLLSEGPFKKYTKLSNGSEFAILAQSAKNVRGPHIPKIKCDEADEFKRIVWEALQFCSFSNPEYPSCFEVLSTSHMRGGIMTEALKKAQENKTPIYEWCIMDVLEPCPSSRTCKKKDGKFCILYDDCKGVAKKPWKQGFFPIDDAIKIKQRATQERWDVEMMLKKPDATGTVYPEFEEKIHVIEDLPFNKSYDTYRSFDFGTTDPFVTLYLQKAPDGVLIIVDSLYHEGLAASTVVANMLEHEKKVGMPFAMLNYCDPSGADYRKELEKRGISTIGTQSKKVEGVIAVKERLKIREDGKPGILICKRNTRLIKEMLDYTKDKFLRGGPDDHGPDALRYFCVNSRLWSDKQRLLSSNAYEDNRSKSPWQLRRPSKKAYDPSKYFDKLININKAGGKNG